MAQRQELRGTSRLRSNHAPPELTVLLRGGPDAVSELIDQVQDCAARYTLDGAAFCALSVTAILPGDDECELLGSNPLVNYERVYRMTTRTLQAAGFAVWATFRNPRHFSVQLRDDSQDAVMAFLVVAGPLRDNPEYHHDDDEEVDR